jgi:hypothetical protein
VHSSDCELSSSRKTSFSNTSNSSSRPIFVTFLQQFLLRNHYYLHNGAKGHVVCSYLLPNMVNIFSYISDVIIFPELC